MPPRYAYWTILVDDQPTAFRAGAKEDLLPTFNRLKEKHASAKMMWFQNGKLWPSRLDAQEAMLARGEMGRRGDERQLARRSFSEGGAGGFRSRDRDFKPKARFEKHEWKPRGKNVGESFSSPAGERKERREPGEKLDWKPKGEFTPAPKRSEKPDWKPKGSFDRKPEWKSKTSRPQDLKTSRSEKPEWKPKGTFDRKPEWKPRAESGTRNEEPGTAAKRKWVPKAEYKKSLGIEAKRDEKWRPGGEHRDPKQKYKDAKKAKWTKFKKNIRTKWESKKKP